MAKRIRIGIIGVGIIGKHHLENYAKLEGVEVVAACDIDEAELARVAEKFRIPRTFSDFRRLLEMKEIDAVDVCLHNNLHAPVTIAALRAGKHVYCEKPMAGTYFDAKAMAEAARECDRKLSIQLGTVFSKATKAAKRLVDEGKLGKLYHARSTGYRRRGRPFVDGYATANFVRKDIAGGGALYDMGVYHIAQLLWLMGIPRPTRICGALYQETAMDEERRRRSGYDVEELGVGLVHFEGGLTLDIVEAWAIHLDSFESSCLVGSAGGIRLEPFGYFTSAGDLDLDCTSDLDATDTRRHRLRENEDCFDSSQAHWIAALLGRVELIPTDRIALATMLISEGIYLSGRLGREVTSEEVERESRSTALDV